MLTVDKNTTVNERNRLNSTYDSYNNERFTVISPPEENQSVPQYKMSRLINSVKDLWNEFNVVVNGAPSIESLEHKYGNRWCQSAADSKYFSKRKLFHNS